MFQRFFKLDSENRVVGIREGSYSLEDKNIEEVIIPSANNKEFDSYMYNILIDEKLINDETAVNKRQAEKEMREALTRPPTPSE